MHDLTEEEARERLLKRVSGQRLKPFCKPDYPGSPRTITQRPSYPSRPSSTAPNRAHSPEGESVTQHIDRLIYAQRAQKEYDSLDLTVLSQPGADDLDAPKPRLSALFVPLHAKRSRPPQSLPRDYLISQDIDVDLETSQFNNLLQRWEAAERKPLFDIIADKSSKALVILGDPGSGKSSFCRYLLLSLLTQATSKLNKPWYAPIKDYLPFLIELRDYLNYLDDNKGAGVVDYLDFFGQKLGFGFRKKQVIAQLSNKKTLLIFDGLDEIFDSTKRRFIVRHIIGFCETYRKSRIIVTSRIAGYESHPFDAAQFQTVTIDELENDEIVSFAARWFNMAFDGNAQQARRSSDDFLNTLRVKPSLEILSRNPLLLTIMAVVARHERLARSRSGLYAQALKVLCYSWDYRKDLQLSQFSKVRELTPNDKMVLLQEIAWHMQKNLGALRANAIQEAELREIIARYFANEWNYDRSTCQGAATEMMDLLQRRNWVVTVRGPALFCFVHRTFLEYLCSAKLVTLFQNREMSFEELRDQYLLSRIGDDSWHEVIRLATAQLHPKFAVEVVRGIIPDRYITEEFTTRSLLALQCISEQESRRLVQFKSEVLAVIRGIYELVSNIESHDDGMRFYSTIEPFKSVLSDVEWPVDTLAKVGWPRPSGTLANYIDIVTWLVSVFWRRKPEAKQTLCRWLITKKSVFEKISIICALGESFFELEDVVLELMACSQLDEDEDVRWRAYRMVEANKASAVEIATRHLCDCKNHRNRMGALGFLCGLSAETKSARAWLESILLRDPSEEVRSWARQYYLDRGVGGEARLRRIAQIGLARGTRLRERVNSVWLLLQQRDHSDGLVEWVEREVFAARSFLLKMAYLNVIVRYKFDYALDNYALLKRIGLSIRTSRHKKIFRELRTRNVCVAEVAPIILIYTRERSMSVLGRDC